MGPRRHLSRGCPEVPGGMIRVPESLLTRYVELMKLLGPGAGHAAVMQFLFATAQIRIDDMVREAAARVSVPDVMAEDDVVERLAIPKGDEDFLAKQVVGNGVPSIGVASKAAIPDFQMPKGPVADSQRTHDAVVADRHVKGSNADDITPMPSDE